MPKVVEGYVLDIATAAGIPAVDVTVYDANSNSALAGVAGLTTNPATTDAAGHFKVTMDLSPGPIYADAAIPGGNHERRFGLEQMEIGDHWMSDIPVVLHLFTDGVVRGVLNELAVSVSGSINTYTVATGNAIVRGYAWTLESGSFTATIPANTTLANRHDMVVLRQYTAGPYQGKQLIDLILGTTTGVDPVPRQGTVVGSDTIWEFPLATLNTVQNAGTSTILQDDRVFADNASAGTPRLAVELIDEFSGALQHFAPFVATGGVVAEGPLTLDSNHPGVWTATTGGSTNAKAGVVGAQFLFANIVEFEMIFKPVLSGTMIQRYGVYGATTDQFGAIQYGVLAEFDNSGRADTLLTLRQYVAATPTVLGTLALAAHWYRLNWAQTSSTSGVLTLRDLDAPASVQGTASGLIVSFVKPAMGVQAKAAASYVAALDWFRLKLGGMTR